MKNEKEEPLSIREAKPYFVDTLPCEYEPPDDRTLDEMVILQTRGGSAET